MSPGDAAERARRRAEREARVRELRDTDRQQMAADRAGAPGAAANRAERRRRVKAAKTWIPALERLLDGDLVGGGAGGRRGLTAGAVATHLAALAVWVRGGQTDITAREVAAACGRPTGSVRKCLVEQLGEFWQVEPRRQRIRPAASYAEMLAGACGEYGQMPLRIVDRLCRGAGGEEEDTVRCRFAALVVAVRLAVTHWQHGDIAQTQRRIARQVLRSVRTVGRAVALLREARLVETRPAADDFDGLHYAFRA